jgi:hypothetical protein
MTKPKTDRDSRSMVTHAFIPAKSTRLGDSKKQDHPEQQIILRGQPISRLKSHKTRQGRDEKNP